MKLLNTSLTINLKDCQAQIFKLDEYDERKKEGFNYELVLSKTTTYYQRSVTNFNTFKEAIQAVIDYDNCL